ncbi:MAG TPA: DUF748 domain-containing protein [Chryseolinea sp.]|nr:DUF748 domain-containing protein [Chryseolinea sp.]
MKRSHKILTVASIIVFTCVVVLAIGGLFVTRYANRKFDEAMSASGMKISNLSVNLFTRSVTVTGLVWIIPGDILSAKPHTIAIDKVYIGGIDLYQLIKYRKLNIHSLSIDDGTLTFNKGYRVKQDSSNTKKKTLKGLSIANLSLNNVAFKMMDDTLQEYAGMVNASVGRLNIPNLDSIKDIHGFEYNSIDATIAHLAMGARKSMYNCTVASIHVSTFDKEITIDSILLLPKYSKYKFSRKIGRQVDRFVLQLPKLLLQGVSFDEMKDTVFMATSLELRNAKLHVYRDKRLPFIRDHNLPLPIAFVRTLPFSASVDSIKIVDAKITYEEFPEKGFHPGQIVFEKLNASLDHISNRDFYTNYTHATLKASAKVMGNGTIKAQFTLPYEKSQPYNAKGTISNLSLYKLNPILENLAFVSIEEGRLNALDFNFDYNEFTSRGSILLNYEGLKMNSLTRDKEADKNDFKSWVLNMFLKKDKDKDVSVEKRTGKIEYDRDRRRAIFNVWVRSLMSGLKSSVLDTQDKKEKDSKEKEAPNKSKKEKVANS